MPTKLYTKTGRSCRVTFRLPAEVKTKKAFICGDFNEWNAKSHPMKKKKDGSFYVTLYLDAGQTYHYRYKLGDGSWENDWEAEAYAPNEFGEENSIVTL